MESECQQCNWWKRESRPAETFIWITWEWDIDKLKKLKPKQEGVIQVDKWKDCIDYPIIPNVIRPFRVHVDPIHVEHVDLSVPVILGLLDNMDNTKSFPIMVDGHHRLGKAIKEGLETLPCILYDEKQLLKCAISKPPNFKKRRKKT